jgi:hypothetical protein
MLTQDDSRTYPLVPTLEQGGKRGGGQYHISAKTGIYKNSVVLQGQVASMMKKQHMKKCSSLQKKMSNSLVPGVVQLNTDAKKLEWQSSLMSLSIEFTSQ